MYVHAKHTLKEKILSCVLYKHLKTLFYRFVWSGILCSQMGWELLTFLFNLPNAGRADISYQAPVNVLLRYLFMFMCLCRYVWYMWVLLGYTQRVSNQKLELRELWTTQHGAQPLPEQQVLLTTEPLSSFLNSKFVLWIFSTVVFHKSLFMSIFVLFLILR